MVELAHNEDHRIHRATWLRAAVLGANDGIVSTSSLVIGIAAAGSEHHTVLLAGLAGLISGALSMAAGEYVSVRSQADTEKADIEMEAEHLERSPDAELKELTEIYVGRGLDQVLARQVAVQLTEHDALGAHARDELGITETMSARPIQAAIFSAVSFAIGAALPLSVVLIAPHNSVIYVTAISSLIFLACLGAWAAHAGGANRTKGALRVFFWGAAAMLLTPMVGRLFGAVTA